MLVQEKYPAIRVTEVNSALEMHSGEPLRFLPVAEVLKRTGMTMGQFEIVVAFSDFPCPVNLGEDEIAWVDLEIEDWIVARVLDRDRKVAAQEGYTAPTHPNHRRSHLAPGYILEKPM